MASLILGYVSLISDIVKSYVCRKFFLSQKVRGKQYVTEYYTKGGNHCISADLNMQMEFLLAEGSKCHIKAGIQADIEMNVSF